MVVIIRNTRTDFSVIIGASGIFFKFQISIYFILNIFPIAPPTALQFFDFKNNVEFSLGIYLLYSNILL